MSEWDEPQTISSSDLSKARIALAVSLASRPYSSAVLWPTCQGPSISLPRHQSLTFERLGAAVLLAQVAPVGAGRVVDVFDEVAGLVEAARAEVDGEHHLRADRVAPVGEFVDADRVAVGGVPGEVEPGRALLARADAVLPVVGRDEVAAGIAHDRDVEIPDQLRDVAPHPVLVGGRVVGLVDAGVDGAAEMLEEGAVDTIVDPGNRIVLVRRHRRLHCSPPIIVTRSSDPYRWARFIGAEFDPLRQAGIWRHPTLDRASRQLSNTICKSPPSGLYSPCWTYRTAPRRVDWQVNAGAKRYIYQNVDGLRSDPPAVSRQRRPTGRGTGRARAARHPTRKERALYQSQTLEKFPYETDLLIHIVTIDLQPFSRYTKSD